MGQILVRNNGIFVRANTLVQYSPLYRLFNTGHLEMLESRIPKCRLREIRSL